MMIEKEVIPICVKNDNNSYGCPKNFCPGTRMARSYIHAVFYTNWNKGLEMKV
jgi:hypothetical protein